MMAFYLMDLLLMPYHALSPKDAAAFADKHSDLFGDHSQLSAEQLDTTGLNQVFRIKNNRGTSLIVKQALPEHSGLPHHWPVSLHRAQIEADVLKHHAKICPEYLVEVFYYDPELAALLLEDLSDCAVLRHLFFAGQQPERIGLHLGRYLAKTGFYSSDFVLTGPVKKARQLQFNNPELCLVTEDLVFTDPYCNHERNSLGAAQLPELRQLWSDEPLQAEVAQLKADYLTKPQVLLHGDLHCGNVLISHAECKVIGAEFGCYGPAGFDTGTWIASLILNLIVQSASKKTQAQPYFSGQINVFWQEFSAEFATLMQKETRDQSFQNAMYQQHFLRQLWQDTLGYAGCELIRRTVGWAQAEELKKLTDHSVKLEVQRQLLALGRDLIMQRRQLTPAQLLAKLV